MSAFAAKHLAIIPWTSTTLAVAATHANAVIRWNGSADATLTLRDDATVPLPDGFTFTLAHRGPSGFKVSYTQDAAVTVTQLNPGDGALTLWQNGAATFIKDGANSWLALGGFKAAL